jgi:uncharacterized protein YecT (DUF1311 family)
MKTAILTVAVVLAMPACAFAQDADDAFKQTDKKLNELYKQIEARLTDDADTKKLLVQAQRDWVKFRDAECNFQTAGAAGGSMMPMLVAQCMDNLTQFRVKNFERYLNCEESDLSCPVPAPNNVSAASNACDGVKVEVTKARKEEYAPLVASATTSKVKPAQMKFFAILEGGNWSAAYVSTPVADDGMMFFQTVNGKKQFRDVWGGYAEPSEKPELLSWAMKLGAPQDLAKCFAETVTE